MSTLKASIITLILMGLMIINVIAQESIPTMVNYQGFLTDQNGTPLNGSYQITFALYYEPTGAASIVWDETHDVINVENGFFNVLLGSIDTLAVEDLHGERYLGIRIVGEPEMTPRMRVASVAYSLRAEDANTLNNKHSSAFVSVGGDTINGPLLVNGKVGVGTTTPNAGIDLKNIDSNSPALKIISSTNESIFSVSDNGNVDFNNWDGFWEGTDTNGYLEKKGYVRIGSFLIQWGHKTLDDGIFTITFLQSFKDDFVSVTVNRQVENPASPLEAYDITANDFKINRENNISGWGLCNWMAIGPAE